MILSTQETLCVHPAFKHVPMWNPDGGFPPDKVADGQAMLDWEPRGLEGQAVVDGYLKRINEAKAAYPSTGIRWGVYDLRIRRVWQDQRDQTWLDDVKAFYPVYKLCNFIMVNVGRFYLADDPHFSERDHQDYVRECLTQALMIGRELRLPVIANIDDVYHDSLPVGQALVQVPPELIERDVEFICRVCWSGNRAVQINWWGAKQFYFDLGQKSVNPYLDTDDAPLWDKAVAANKGLTQDDIVLHARQTTNAIIRGARAAGRLISK